MFIMANYFVVGWHPDGSQPFFFRGDNRYEIFLPYISERLIKKLDGGSPPGWVPNPDYARVFTYPFDWESVKFSKHMDAIDRGRCKDWKYHGKILITQIFWPIKRPRRCPHFS